MSIKNADMQGLGIENGGYCVGCPGGPEGGCYLTQQTLPMCLTTAQREPAAAVFLYFLCARRSPTQMSISSAGKVLKIHFKSRILSCAEVKFWEYGLYDCDVLRERL